MRVKRAHDVIWSQQREQTIRAYMHWWRMQLHQKENYEHKAVPFHENVVLGNLKRRVFEALLVNMQDNQD